MSRDQDGMGPGEPAERAVPEVVEPRDPAAEQAALRRVAEMVARGAASEEVFAAAAEVMAKLVASRARIVASADEARRRLQREVHDGAQQRLVHAVIALKMARNAVEVGSDGARLIEEALTNLEGATSELRGIVHRILPRSLTYGGLSTGLHSLAAEMAVPVEVTVATARLPAAVETTAYLIVAEALTNAATHSRAQKVYVTVEHDKETLVVEVRDDGIGGADSGNGTGLIGLFDRVDAAGGSLAVLSPPGQGTTVRAELPVPSGDDRGAV